jgi:hypothetical protein
MGRGRAKAKQTKVARALKYHSPETDLAALQRELGGRERSGGAGPGNSADLDDNEAYGEYADEVDDDADEDDDDDQDEADGRWATRHAT